MQHRPRKRFGQNFLQDSMIIHAIIDAIAPEKEDLLIEIGPGLGALTRPLLQHTNHLTAIEIDPQLHEHLHALVQSKQHLHLIQADALSIDFSTFGPQIRLVGNLAYNMATALLIHLLPFLSYVQDMHFMVQHEVAKRLIATPASKAYGRLSIMMQYHAQIEYVLSVPASAFYPKPKVESAIVRLTPHRSPAYPNVNVTDLETLVAKAFSMRRKTLANNLKGVMDADTIMTLGIDPSMRPEHLSILDYIHLTHAMKQASRHDASRL